MSQNADATVPQTVIRYTADIARCWKIFLCARQVSRCITLLRHNRLDRNEECDSTVATTFPPSLHPCSMWSICLGYLCSSFDWHWMFLFEFQSPDDSFDCPSDCDQIDCSHGEVIEDFFVLDQFHNLLPQHKYHILRVLCEDDIWKFEHKGLDDISRDISFSKQLGTCEDASLVPIIEGCRDIAVPSENSPDLISRAMELVDMHGELWPSHYAGTR